MMVVVVVKLLKLNLSRALVLKVSLEDFVLKRFGVQLCCIPVVVIL